MTKQKFGLILFVIAVIWSIGWGIAVSVVCNNAIHSAATLEELNQSTWALTGPMMLVWGILGVPFGAIIAMIGMFLYSGAKGLKAWLSGLVVILGIAGGMAVVFLGHIRVLFGFGGSLILLFFCGILWFWGKERKGLKDAFACAADLKLIGFTFMLVAAWFTCGGFSLPFHEATEAIPPSTPINIMIYLVLGWFFLFLGHYKAGK